MDTTVLDSFRQDLVPEELLKASEVTGRSVADITKEASEAYYEFLDSSLAGYLQFSSESDGMSKEAAEETMEKLSEMEKQGFVLMGTMAALMAAGFGAISAYDLAKNMYGGTKDVLHGRFGKALKRVPAMGFDTLGLLPGVAVASKAPKVLGFLNKARKAGKFKEGLKLLPQWQQTVAKYKLAPGMLEKSHKLKSGKALISNPKTWFMNTADRLKEAEKYRQKSIEYYKTPQALKPKIESILGKGTGNYKRIEGELPMRRALGWTNKKMKAVDYVPAFDAFHDEGAHKMFQWAWPLDNLSMIRMAPVVPLLAGAATGSEGLKSVGGKMMSTLNYYGEDEEGMDEETKRKLMMLRQARYAARNAGYMGGYMAHRR